MIGLVAAGCAYVAGVRGNRVGGNSQPPLEAGAVKLTVACPLPAVAVTPVGAPGGPIVENVAVTICAAFIVTVHVPAPLHPPPDQPEKYEPAFGVAVKVTDVPLLYGAKHVEPQFMPDGLLVTVPPPVPALVTVRPNVPVSVCIALTSALASTEPRPVTGS